MALNDSEEFIPLGDIILRLEHYLRENAVYEVNTLKDLFYSDEITIFWVKNITHAIILFPNGAIFNCNPELCSNELILFIVKFCLKDNQHLPANIKIMDEGLYKEQIEPNSAAYQLYWNERAEVTNNFIENEQNCILWSVYYLYWYNQKSEGNMFPCELIDLENWCKLQYEILNTDRTELLNCVD